MISRVWGAVAKREHAAAYVAHLQSETFPTLRGIAGFVDDARVRHYEVVG